MSDSTPGAIRSGRHHTAASRRAFVRGADGQATPPDRLRGRGPGVPGRQEPQGDSDPRWRDLAIGFDEVDLDGVALRIAAIREAYEEAGVLLARDKERRLLCRRGGGGRPGAVAEDKVAFIDVVEELGLKLDLSALTVFARWITPKLMPKRFDTWFYVAHAPLAQQAICDGHEAVDAEWIAPGRALELAASGERKVIFPTRMNLQLLAESADPADAWRGRRRVSWSRSSRGSTGRSCGSRRTRAMAGDGAAGRALRLLRSRGPRPRRIDPGHHVAQHLGGRPGHRPARWPRHGCRRPLRGPRTPGRRPGRGR
jgi:8-oxo-dGTP pyrophosphatase MutT (NUDIX family)